MNKFLSVRRKENKYEKKIPKNESIYVGCMHGG